MPQHRKTYMVWYSTSEFFPSALCGEWPSPDLSTHKLLTCVDLFPAQDTTTKENFGAVYRQMQAENWSPNGEAAGTIQLLNLSHTSMSIGDLIEYDGKFYAVAPFGFRDLEKEGWKRAETPNAEKVPAHWEEEDGAREYAEGLEHR